MNINIEVTKEDLAKPILPVGETYEDSRRLNNLEERIKIVDYLLSDIVEVATGKERVEYSIKKAGKVADEFLDELRDALTK